MCLLYRSEDLHRLAGLSVDLGLPLPDPRSLVRTGVGAGVDQRLFHCRLLDVDPARQQRSPTSIRMAGTAASTGLVRFPEARTLASAWVNDSQLP